MLRSMMTHEDFHFFAHLALRIPMIYMTDCRPADGRYPEVEPHYPVLWLNTAPGTPFDPPWGERIDFEEEAS